MKKKKIFLLVLFIIIGNIVFGCAGQEKQKEFRKLTVYLDAYSPMISIIDEYNGQQEDMEKQIAYEIFYIENVSDIENKRDRITSELLAGEGPDLFYFGFSGEGLDLNKLSEEGIFAELEGLMDFGVFNNIGGIQPISYTIPL